MKTRWGQALVAITVLIASVVFTPTVAAQKGTFGNLPAGDYHFSSAGVDFNSFANNISLFFNVGVNNNVSRPEDGPQTTSSQTEVFLSLFDNNNFTFTFACLFLDRPSDFTIDNGLTAATLSTTLTSATPTCPGSSPLTTDIAITASWIGVGPIATDSGESTYRCGKYKSEAVGRNVSNLGTANLTLTTGGVTTTFSSPQIGFNSNDSRIEAKGVADPACGPAGLGAGAMPAGEYHMFGLSANAFFGFPPGPTNQISLMENNQSSQPQGLPASTSQEFDLNVSLFGGAFSGFGCWIISPTDVTSTGLTSAIIKTTVTTANLNCTNSFPGFGINFPMTVNVAWTGTGPLVTVRTEDNFRCLNYSQSTETSVQSNTATSIATVTMPDFFGNPTTVSLTGGVGSLVHADQRIEANGVEQAGCKIRA